MLILREIMDPMYGMFQYFPDSRLMWFSEEVGFFCDCLFIYLNSKLFIVLWISINQAPLNGLFL